MAEAHREAPKTPVQRLASSQLSPELVDRQGKVLAWVMKPKSESGLGACGYQGAGCKVDQAITDVCNLLYDDKDAPRLVSVEYFYHLVWALLYAASRSDFPWYDDLIHWRYSGTRPAEEYLDYVYRRQVTEGRMLGALAHGPEVAQPPRVSFGKGRRLPREEYAEIMLRISTHVSQYNANSPPFTAHALQQPIPIPQQAMQPQHQERYPEPQAEPYRGHPGIVPRPQPRVPVAPQYFPMPLEQTTPSPRKKSNDTPKQPKGQKRKSGNLDDTENSSKKKKKRHGKKSHHRTPQASQPPVIVISSESPTSRRIKKERFD
ncbi:hypothetical protein B0T14DRAFT_590307 [Immersiella caudata]|uniref:Uncharacterized protein n=1 Tax=Immersiella caudata TaxID=314043 RepID=A0AA40BXS7_9PEZI|nr:hypothetical protein B0T14DRAFT_590307 [Immersiella caudata]